MRRSVEQGTGRIESRPHQGKVRGPFGSCLVYELWMVGDSVVEEHFEYRSIGDGKIRLDNNIRKLLPLLMLSLTETNAR